MTFLFTQGCIVYFPFFLTFALYEYKNKAMLSMYLIGFMGGYEWILIILALVLLFGGKKIPELMKGLGKGMSEFKKAKKEVEESVKEDDKE